MDRGDWRASVHGVAKSWTQPKQFSTLWKTNIPEVLTFIVQLVKNPHAMQEIPVGFLGWEDFRKKGKATHYSGLENSMDCIVHGVAKSWTRLSDLHFHFLL